MADSQHARPFAGNYDDLPETKREQENKLSGKNIKINELVQDCEINCRAFFVMMLMSNCPDKNCDWEAVLDNAANM